MLLFPYPLRVSVNLMLLCLDLQRVSSFRMLLFLILLREKNFQKLLFVYLLSVRLDLLFLLKNPQHVNIDHQLLCYHLQHDLYLQSLLFDNLLKDR